MIDLAPGAMLGPSSGYARLMHYKGLTAAQAFDCIAERAAQPACQAMIADWCATPEGRTLLRDVRSAWDKEGLPCPWENVLDLTPMCTTDG